ncbi:MAG: hypothetical protein H7X86_00500 [Gorillibacterium sp.]|nr:hypothetical protein [Gorillibacterium sp.]
MSKKWSKVVLASSLVFASVSSIVPMTNAAFANAASQDLQTVQNQLFVDGQSSGVRTVKVNGVMLYAIRDLANALGAQLKQVDGEISVSLNNSFFATSTVMIKPGQTMYTANGETRTFITAPTYVAGRIYVELQSFVEALGGTLTKVNGKAAILSYALLDGSFENAQWVAGNKVIALRESDKMTYIIDADTGRSTLLTDSGNADGIVLSPNGEYGVYLNESAQLTLIRITNGRNQLISPDTTVKTDLVWSADGKMIYFIQGDNQEKISKINVETGTITKLVDDKVNFKSDLRVSMDEKKLLYFVNATGVAKNDADSTEDSLTIDYSGAGTKLNSFDLSVKDAKAVERAVGKDNKLAPQLLPDGRPLYISIDLDSEGVIGVLTVVDSDNKSSALLPGINADSTWLNAMGDLIISSTDDKGQTVLYLVKPDGSKTMVTTTDLEVSDLSLTMDGKNVTTIVDGKVAIITPAGVTYLTK